MSKRTKLELTWIGKDERPRLEPRILLEDPELSYRAATPRAGEITDNLLIHGDNLLALKALEAEFTGKVKCIYIDPPYNTGSAFEHYDDGVEHSLWLSANPGSPRDPHAFVEGGWQSLDYSRRQRGALSQGRSG
jgi:adenine-specific DNA-methyltransferase